MTLPIKPAPLMARLERAAAQWTDATGFSLARLGRLVVNDGGYFSRIAGNPVTTTATLEKFARFLGDSANWPDGAVPEEVAAFAHVTGVTAEMEQSSTGQNNHLPGRSDAPAPLGAASTGERFSPSAPLSGGGTLPGGIA